MSASVSKRVLIVGGGVIGLSAAHYCALKGHQVTVVERGAAERNGCSFANAGMIVPSHFIPLASPGVVQLGLRWMWNPESPFHVQPRFSSELLDWGWKLYRAATPARVAAAAESESAGVMPLNTFNDAVGPMAKSVRELGLVLDRVAGVDPEDEATAEADRHIAGSFADMLDPGALHGARLGVLRQLFVGVTGEREAAAMMERVIGELRAAGATVIDVAIPDLDAQYRAARGSAPGSLKAAWNGYLARGAKPDEQPLTIDGLLASGKLAPESARRFQDGLQPVPAGMALREATRRFYAGREQFRDLFVGLMDGEHLDALLYPANQARPHTHEGGLERYGGEPGTCEESAMTGLPQVTVPAGLLGGRYPFGISFLGRLWSDARVLSLAHAYEQATHHRRPPPDR